MTNTDTGSKKTCLTCDNYDGSVCKIDGFIMGSRDCSCERYERRPSSAGNKKNGARQAITDKERRAIALMTALRSRVSTSGQTATGRGIRCLDIR